LKFVFSLKIGVCNLKINNMLIILHGDNIVASRAELVRLKDLAKDKEIRDINGKDISESELRQAVESLSLFGSTVLVALENIFSPLGRKEKLIKLYADILIQAGKTATIIIWEPKELGKTALTCLKDANIHLFKTPGIIFAFLDALVPGNARNVIGTYEKAETTEAPELILYMVQNRVRQLIQVKDGITPNRISGWQLSRLTNQGKSFTMDKLLIMHNRLIELEYSFKTGAAPFTLSQLITQFILDL